MPSTAENWVFVRAWSWRGNVFLGSYLDLDSSTKMMPLSWLAVCCHLKRVFSECFSNVTLISQVTVLMCMGSERLHLPHRLIYWLSIRKDAVLVSTKEQMHDLRALLKHRRFHSNYQSFPYCYNHLNSALKFFLALAFIFYSLVRVGKVANMLQSSMKWWNCCSVFQCTKFVSLRVSF